MSKTTRLGLNNSGKRVLLVISGILLCLVLTAFGPLFVINNTLLNPDFVTAEVQKFQVAEFFKEAYLKPLPAGDRYAAFINETIEDLRPWLQQEMVKNVSGMEEYVLGNTDNLTISTSLDPVKNAINTTFSKNLSESPPPEFQQLSPENKALAVKQLEAQMAAQVDAIPSVIVPDTGLRDLLDDLREPVKFLRVSYWIAIGAIIALFAAIYFLGRRVKPVARTVGIVVFIAGLLNTALFMSVNDALLAQALSPALPDSIKVWAFGAVQDVFRPLNIYSIAFMIIGFALVIFSIRVKSPLEPVTASK